jgi:hypothetical protein
LKFPVTIRHRDATVTIYSPKEDFAYYRAAWKAAGKNLRRTFKTYSAAKEFAERTARELAKGEQPVALSEREFTDALAVRAALDALRPLFAIGGLGGLRTAELLRLDWADVWPAMSRSPTARTRLVSAAWSKSAPPCPRGLSPSRANENNPAS